MKCAETGQFSRWRQHLHRKMYTNHSWWKGLVMSSVATTSWVKSNGTECQNGMFVCVGAENDFSTFRKITIFMMKVFLLTTNLSTTGFDEEQNKFETWWGFVHCYWSVWHGFIMGVMGSFHMNTHRVLFCRSCLECTKYFIIENCFELKSWMCFI